MTTKSVGTRAGSIWGVVVLGGVAVFVAIVAILHIVQPGYDPSTQLMSELALGPYGAAMVVAFCGLAVAVFGVHTSTRGLGAGNGLQLVLLGAAVSFLLAGIFPLGAASEVHIVAIASAFIMCVLAMYLFPTLAGLASQLAPRAFSWTMAVGVAVSVGLGHSVMPMGIGQRAAASFLLLWLAVIGWRLSRPIALAGVEEASCPAAQQDR